MSLLRLPLRLWALLCLVILMLYGLSTRTSRPALARVGP